jgi:hypothetical protein
MKYAAKACISLNFMQFVQSNKKHKVTRNTNNSHQNNIGMPAAYLHHYHTFLPSCVELLGRLVQFQEVDGT